MKLSKRKVELIEKIAVLGGIFLIVFVTGYYTGYFNKDCGQDKACFNELLKKCRAAEVTSIRQNNVYTYASYPGLSGYCNLKVTLKRVVVGAPLEFKDIEGKSMLCKIKKEELTSVDLDAMNDLLKKCSGELKEGLYEIIIQRMYGLMITQMDDVVKEAKKVLEE